VTGFRKPTDSEKNQSSAIEKTDLSAAVPVPLPAVTDESQRPKRDEITTGTGFRISGIKPPTVVDLEEVRKKAYEEGFKEGKVAGHTAGYDAGAKKGEAEKKAEAAQTAQVTRALMQPIEQQDEELENVMLSMVMQISKLILKRELKVDSSQVLEIVREALSTLNCGSKKIKILLHPHDLANILPEIKKLPEYEESWRIVERSGLSPGGCIVESNEGLVDASVDHRVEQLIAQIYEEKIPDMDENDDETTSAETKSEFLDDGEPSS